MLTLWLWLWLIPAAVGLSARSWGSCLGLVSVYIVLFDLDTAIVSVRTTRPAEFAAVLLDDNLMILALATAWHGLRHAFRSPDL